MTDDGTATAAAPPRSFSSAVRSAGLVWLSGHVALDPATGKPVGDDFATQAHYIFASMERTLAEHGATLADVIRIECFLTDADDFSQWDEIFVGYFGRACEPDVQGSGRACEPDIQGSGRACEPDVQGSGRACEPDVQGSGRACEPDVQDNRRVRAPDLERSVRAGETPQPESQSSSNNGRARTPEIPHNPPSTPSAPPARTTLVTKLALPGLRLEIQAVAGISRGGDQP